jgi:hypothetical protein
MSVTVDVVETSELGDRSYIDHDARSVIVVDPQRTWTGWRACSLNSASAARPFWRPASTTIM